MPKMKCKRCGWIWNSRKQLPRACPWCKRYGTTEPYIIVDDSKPEEQPCQI